MRLTKSEAVVVVWRSWYYSLCFGWQRAAVVLSSGDRGGYQQRGYPSGDPSQQQSPSYQQQQAGAEEEQQSQRGGGVVGWLSKWKKFFRRGNKDTSDSFVRDTLPHH